MARSCTYTHDISKEYFADRAGDRWECSHEATAGTDRCLFHASPEETDPSRVNERFRELVETHHGPVELIGARLESMQLTYAILDGPSNHPIDLRDATVDGPVSLERATIRRPLRLDGMVFSDSVSFEGATFDRRVTLARATFAGPTTLEFAEIGAWFDISHCTFQGPVVGRVAEFTQGIVAEHVTFRDAADFMAARFRGAANFHSASFHAGAVFDSADFDADVRLDETTLAAPTIQTNPESTTSLVDDELAIEGVSISLDGAVCQKNVYFENATVDGNIRFADLQIGQDIRTAGLSTDSEITVECARSETIRGEIDDCRGAITYDLTDATVGALSFVEGTTIDALSFDGTRFDGFDFGSHKQVLAARGWRLHDAEAAASPEQRETLYLRAKNGAKEMGETRIAAEFFVQEMRFRRTGHRRQVAEASRLREKFRAGGHWLGNVALGVTCGYGERPFRPVLFSLGIVFVFAGLLATLDPPLSYSRPAGYLIFSAEGFVSLILGLPSSSGTIVSLLIVTEAFLGGFVVALFVFTLTRSVSR